MTVQPVDGERGRFWVGSESGAEPYLVDLEEFGGNGWCACKHFETRMQPKLVEAEERRAKAPVLRCKHLEAVLRQLEARN